MSAIIENCIFEIESCFRNSKQVWRFEELVAATGWDRTAVADSLARLFHERKVERLIPVGSSEDCLIGSEPGDVPIFYRWTLSPPRSHPVMRWLHIRREGGPTQNHGCESES